MIKCIFEQTVIRKIMTMINSRGLKVLNKIITVTVTNLPGSWVTQTKPTQ